MGGKVRFGSEECRSTLGLPARTSVSARPPRLAGTLALQVLRATLCYGQRVARIEGRLAGTLALRSPSGRCGAGGPTSVSAGESGRDFGNRRRPPAPLSRPPRVAREMQAIGTARGNLQKAQIKHFLRHGPGGEQLARTTGSWIPVSRLCTKPGVPCRTLFVRYPR
jgi:hypothetical protein